MRKKCHHCGGSMYLESDNYGRRLTCIICGRGFEFDDDNPMLLLRSGRRLTRRDVERLSA